MKGFVKALMTLILFCFIFSGCMQNTGYTILNGQYTKTENGDHMFSYETDSGEEVQVMMTGSPHGDASFDDLQTGDRIRIKIVLIKENEGVLTTEVFECKKTG